MNAKKLALAAAAALMLGGGAFAFSTGVLAGEFDGQEAQLAAVNTYHIAETEGAAPGIPHYADKRGPGIITFAQADGQQAVFDPSWAMAVLDNAAGSSGTPMISPTMVVSDNSGPTEILAADVGGSASGITAGGIGRLAASDLGAEAIGTGSGGPVLVADDDRFTHIPNGDG